jgi:hypothetical protein
VIERHRAGGATDRTREQLAHLNSVLSVVLAGDFPLGDVPWHKLKRARAWLDRLVTEIA